MIDEKEWENFIENELPRYFEKDLGIDHCDNVFVRGEIFTAKLELSDIFKKLLLDMDKTAKEYSRYNHEQHKLVISLRLENTRLKEELCKLVMQNSLGDQSHD